MSEDFERQGTGETYGGDNAVLSMLQRSTFISELLRGRAPKLPHYTAATLPTADATQRYAMAVRQTDAAPDEAIICLLTDDSPETYEWVAFGLMDTLSVVTLTVTGNIEIDGDLNHDGTYAGFFGVTPVDRPGATEDIKDALASLGLLTNGGASPLNLDGGALVAGAATVTTMSATGNAQTNGIFYANGGFRHIAGNLLFWDGTGHASKPTVTGSRGGNAALASLLTALATYGLITDSSS